MSNDGHYEQTGSLKTKQGDEVIAVWIPNKPHPPEWMDKFTNENKALADEFARLGSVKHFAIRLGFMPHDELHAERILKSIIDESGNPR